MSWINLHAAAWDARGARIIGSGDAIMLMHDGFAINFAEHVSDMETASALAPSNAIARRWTLKKRRLTRAEKKSFSQNCYKVFGSPLCLSPKRACRKNAVADKTNSRAFSVIDKTDFLLQFFIAFLSCDESLITGTDPATSIGWMDKWNRSLYERRLQEAVEFINIISDTTLSDISRMWS